MPIKWIILGLQTNKIKRSGLRITNTTYIISKVTSIMHDYKILYRKAIPVNINLTSPICALCHPCKMLQNKLEVQLM